MNWLQTTGLRILLAIGLSFALWAFVSYSENPDTTRRFSDLPVSMVGSSPGLVLVDDRGLPRQGLEPVSVIVRADEETLSQITSAGDIEAYVDLTGLGAGQHTVNVEGRVRGNRLPLEFYQFEPQSISLQLEEELTTTVPLRLEMQGNVPFSYELGESALSLNGNPISEVQLRGPRSRVERVEYAEVVANVDGRTASYESPINLQPVDASGQLVRGVEVLPGTVSVSVAIRPSVGLKRVPVIHNVIGQPAAGYAVGQVRVDQEFVNITGSSGVLDQVASVSTLPIDVSQASATLEVAVALVLPPRTSLQSGQENTVSVTVEIVPVSQPFSIRVPVGVQVVGLGDLLLERVSPSAVQVTISGTAAQLGQLNPSSLVARVSAVGLQPGSSQVRPVIDLPPGFAIVGEIPLVTLTLAVPPTLTPEIEPTLQAEPTPTTTAEDGVAQTPESTVAPSETATSNPNSTATVGPLPTVTTRPTP